MTNGEAIGAGHSLARDARDDAGKYLHSRISREHRDATSPTRHGMKITVLGREGNGSRRNGIVPVRRAGNAAGSKAHRCSSTTAAKPSDKPVTLVGKGLCFDSGGISIKPAQGMEDMKFDMCGAAGVLGAFEAIGSMKLPINVVGLIGSTTNMPSGTAMNPGDVVKSHSESTSRSSTPMRKDVSFSPTCLSYARRFNPAVVIDAATLTGACVIALGHTATGVFSRRRRARLPKSLRQASEQVSRAGRCRCGTNTRS